MQTEKEKKMFFQLGTQVGVVPKSLAEPGHRDPVSRSEQDCVVPLTAPGRMVHKQLALYRCSLIYFMNKQC